MVFLELKEQLLRLRLNRNEDPFVSSHPASIYNNVAPER